ncbi:MAG: N4-gp56 family major capsid protein [Burkholderiaceae bacterium]|nr:N4-gp56 family major capsid protein [Burkholderiaceae bacterium]
MSAQGYTTVASRNLIRAAQGMLEHAQPIIVLGDFGEQREMPKNNTDTLVFRRILPFGAVSTGSGIGSNQYVGTPQITANSFVLSEGVTPNANTVGAQDVSVTLQNFGILFKITSKTELLYEDNLSEEMVTITGETMGEILELVRYGQLKAGTQVVYSNGSSRSSVNTPLGIGKLRLAARILESNRGKRITEKLSPSVNFATIPVEPGFLVFHHTDCNADVRNLPDFTPVAKYGQAKPVHARELGTCEEFRFIPSPLFVPFLAAGSATLNGMVSVGGSNVDVYPYLVVAAKAWGQVALKGMSAITPTVLKANNINHANPLGMFGYVGASTWFNAVRLNDAWMLRIECGATNY